MAFLQESSFALRSADVPAAQKYFGVGGRLYPGRDSAHEIAHEKIGKGAGAFEKIQGYDEAKCLWTSQIHRIHPNMPAATMTGIGLMWDFQKRIVHAAVIT